MTLDFDVERFNDAVAESDQLHHESMRTFDRDLGDLHAETRQAMGGSSRRDLLIRSALATTALTLGGQVIPLRGLLTGVAGAQTLTDADIAAFAASFEYAIVETYVAGAATGKLTTPAVAEVLTTFTAQHKSHGDAFAAASAGKIIPGSPNKTVMTALTTKLGLAEVEIDIVKLAFEVENAAAATYQLALGTLEGITYQQLAASILPVEAGHAAMLGHVIFKGDPKADREKIWLPAFQTEIGSVDPTKNPLV